MRKVLLFLLLLNLLSPAFTQEAGTESFVPFVSKLKAKADESQILITWRNPSNLEGVLLLYRHSTEIGQNNLSEAVPVASLGADQESYRDTPPDDKLYYYAVLIEDPSAVIQELFIPFRNKTSEGVRITAPPPMESEAARITGIKAEVVYDSVQVVFENSNPDRNLLLFRGASPMTTSEDLLNASAPLQLKPGTTRYVDYPIPGVESYYAVLDTEMFKLGRQILSARENTTLQGVVVPLEVPRVALPPVSGVTAAAGADAGRDTQGSAGPEAAAQASTTAIALPYLQLAEDSESVFTIPPRREELDPLTEAAVSRVLASAAPLAAGQKTVVILPEDKNEPGGGESTGLYNILQEHLLAGDYAGAESKLQGFLNLRRSPYTEARVRFYLAQAYYFQGLYEEALLEFVLSQGQLYTPVQPWLESCFRHLWE